MCKFCPPPPSPLLNYTLPPVPADRGKAEAQIMEWLDELNAPRAAEKPPNEPEFVQLGKEVGQLVEEKQKQYGDSFARAEVILRILYPEGISTKSYRDALAITRVLDKLSRIATDNDPAGENPWRDIAGYALLSMRNR